MSITSANERFAAFESLHRAGQPLLLPNAWDAASALLLQDAGFPAVATTSLGVTAAAGLPDGVGLGRDTVLELAKALTARLHVPFSVDIEGGYSDDPAEVADYVAELSAAGVVGVNLEDGRAKGSLRPVEQHVAIVRAVTSAVPGVFVNARTDSYWLKTEPAQGRLDETLRRVVAYREAGAHGIFVPGLTELADVAVVASTAQAPLNVLWRPDVSLAELAGAGVARVSTGSALYRTALGAALATARRAREESVSGEPAEPVGYDSVQALFAD
jgi:2-methylisocitrate lyase-like PEP mutase family enzyme